MVNQLLVIELIREKYFVTSIHNENNSLSKSIGISKSRWSFNILALLHGECLHIPLFIFLNAKGRSLKEGGSFEKNFLK
jgi:hypothetical protein